MAPGVILCTAPNCNTTSPDNLDPQVLVALINGHLQTAHRIAAATQAQPAAKAEKVKPPAVTSSETSGEFTYFQQRWDFYKQATRLDGHDVVFQLLECCDEPLRRDLTRTHGTLTGETEETVLGFIRTLAVRAENIMVARVQLQHLRQNRREPVRAYCARLRGQASVCQFVKKCGCDPARTVDY